MKAENLVVRSEVWKDEKLVVWMAALMAAVVDVELAD